MSEESTFYKKKYFDGRRFYNITMPMAWINRTEPLLNEYFGINYGYFEHLIRQHVPNSFDTQFYSKPYEEQVQELKGWDDKTVEIQHIITFDEFDKLFTDIQLKDGRNNETVIIMTLYMLAYYIIAGQIDDILMEEEDNEAIRSNNPHRPPTRSENLNDNKGEAYAQDKIHEDLLNLYIFLNEPRKWSHSEQGRKITIKFSTGSIDIDNYEHWFVRNVLEPLCKKHIPEITSIKQAEDELYKYKKRAGRPPKDPRILRIIYGIFRMFNENMELFTPQPDSLCEFIIKFLKDLRLIETGLYSPIDNQWIRAQITHADKKPTPPKFPFSDFTRSVTTEEFSAGSRLSGLL